MTQQEVINSTKFPNTEKSLARDFEKLGLKCGDVVMVHSSLSQIGWVCGGEVAVIRALQHVVGENGTICMPAQTGENSDPVQWCCPPVPKEWIDTIYDNMPAFDPLVTPTRWMGRIAELFRTMPGTLRSNHPQVSFCANGKHAASIVASHPLTPQFGMESPLGKLMALDAKVLLLGVPYENCTCLHLSQVLAGNTPKVKLGAAVATNGQRSWVWFDDFDYDTDDFEKIGEGYEKTGEVQKGKAGNADCKLFPMKSAVNFAMEWLKGPKARL